MELKDVYDMPEYQHIRTSLHRKLKKLIKIYNDSGAMAEELR
jgi:hypothetical protein